MKLWGYFRSSAAYRVRIALEWKGIPHETESVHLLHGGGEQHQQRYRSRNPQGLVPALEVDGRVIPQSLAILEYLDEIHPEPPLLPRDPGERARVRAVALAIACDLHPLNNLRVLQYLTGVLGVTESQKDEWYRHWIAVGLGAVEAMLASSPETGRFCHGDRPTLADVCLVPQVANARRFACDLAALPTIVRIEGACLELPAFDRARPENQPDAS